MEATTLSKIAMQTDCVHDEGHCSMRIGANWMMINVCIRPTIGFKLKWTTKYNSRNASFTTARWYKQCLVSYPWIACCNPISRNLVDSLWHAIELLFLLSRYEVKQSTVVVSRLVSGSFFVMAYGLLLDCLSGDLRSLVGGEYLDNSTLFPRVGSHQPGKM